MYNANEPSVHIDTLSFLVYSFCDGAFNVVQGFSKRLSVECAAVYSYICRP